MARKTPEQLQKIKEKHNVSQLYSWSKYNCYASDPYTYYLKYIKKIPEDRNDSIYGISGGYAHTILEKLYGNEIKYEDMINEYENALLDFYMSNLKYDRFNEEKNLLIAQKYEYCLKHFFKNHQQIKNKVLLEQFVLIWIGKFLFQGYIDFLHKEDDCYIITDWKTSSIYEGDKILKECGQLLLYAESLLQKGIPIENIKIRWAFLKYVTVENELANKNKNTRNISRDGIGKSLYSNVKMWLNKTKRYSEEEIESYLSLLLKNNDISHLPDDIKLKYNINDCYVYINFTKDDIDNLKEKIINSICEINEKELKYNSTKDNMVWWKDVTDKDSYFFANLSGYSAKHHKPYAQYLDKLNNKNTETEQDDSWIKELFKDG